MALTIQESGRGGLALAVPVWRRYGRPAAGMILGLVFCLKPGALLPGSWASADIVNLLGQFAVFASALALVACAGGRPLAARVQHTADTLDDIAEPIFVCLLMGGALSLRLALAVFFPDHLTSDAYWYHARAIDLLEGRGYVRPGPIVDGERTMIPTAFWPVGYSAFLAGVYWITGAGWRIGIAVNAVLSGLSVWVLYQIGLALYGRRVARLGAVLVCICPVLWPRMLMSGPLFSLLILCALWLVLVRRDGLPTTLGAGLILTAAVYLRTNGVFFVPVLVLIWWIRTGRLRRALGYGVFCSAVVVALMAPWTMRNWQRFGTFVPGSTNGGVTLLIGAADEATGREPPDYTGPVWERVEQMRLAEYDEIAANRYATESALAWIADHPGRWIGLGFVKVAWMSLSHPWHPPFQLFGRRSQPTPNVEIGFKALCRLASWLALLGFGCYVYVWVVELTQARRECAWLMGVPVAAWLVVTAEAFVFHGLPRFRLPAEGLLILAGTYALLRAVQKPPPWSSNRAARWADSPRK